MSGGTPPCRVCGKSDEVAVYFPEFPERALCPECCEGGSVHEDGETGHVWEYSRFDADHICIHCGQFRNNTPYEHEYD